MATSSFVSVLALTALAPFLDDVISVRRVRPA
jgi:hypothetical protein